MSKAYTTPALVLRRWPAGETALLIRFLTPGEGLLTARAGGAQKQNGSLHFLGNPFTLADVGIVPTRGMSRVTQSTSLATFTNLRTDLPRLQAGALVLEIAEAASTEGLGNPSLFLLTLEALRALEQQSIAVCDDILLGFAWGVLEGLGAAPVLDRCIRTGSAEAGEFVVPLVHEGGFACAEAAYSFPPHARIPITTLHLLDHLATITHTMDELPLLPAFEPHLVRVALAVVLHFTQAAIGAPLKTAEPYLAASPPLVHDRVPGECSET